VEKSVVFVNFANEKDKDSAHSSPKVDRELQPQI